MNFYLDLDNCRFVQEEAPCFSLRSINFLEGLTYTGSFFALKSGVSVPFESAVLNLLAENSQSFYAVGQVSGSTYSLTVDGEALRNELKATPFVEGILSSVIVENEETKVISPIPAKIVANPSIESVPLIADIVNIHGSYNYVSGDTVSIIGDNNTVSAQSVTVSGDAIFSGDSTVTVASAFFTDGTNNISADVAGITGGYNSIESDSVSINGGRNSISGGINSVTSNAPRIYDGQNTISGETVSITGNSNVVEHTETANIVGSNNTLYPNTANITGDNNTIGYANNVYGDNNTFNGEGFNSIYGTASISGGQNQIVGTVSSISGGTNILSGSSKVTASFWLDEIYTGNFVHELFVEDFLTVTGYKIGAIASGTAGTLTGAFYQRSTGNLTGMISPFSLSAGSVFKIQSFPSVSITGGNRIGFSVYPPSSGVSGMAGVTMALLGHQSFVS